MNLDLGGGDGEKENDFVCCAGAADCDGGDGDDRENLEHLEEDVDVVVLGVLLAVVVEQFRVKLLAFPVPSRWRKRLSRSPSWW